MLRLLGLLSEGMWVGLAAHQRIVIMANLCRRVAYGAWEDHGSYHLH